MNPMLHPWHAIILGIIEGATEFLPVSSTGHLILANYLLGLDGEGVKTFDIVTQAGALAAVAGLYRQRLRAMGAGLIGRDPSGRRLLRNLVLAFLPAGLVGFGFHRAIKASLFGIWPVTAALAIGGLAMVAADRWLRRRAATSRTLESITPSEALLIGTVQCLALWPGTSRAMVTLVAGMALGLPAAVAAEFSFLLALPTLGIAAVFEAATGAVALGQLCSAVSVVCGFVAAMLVAAAAIQGLVRFLSRGGLAPFGWYRVGLAALVWSVLRSA